MEITYNKKSDVKSNIPRCGWHNDYGTDMEGRGRDWSIPRSSMKAINEAYEDYMESCRF